MKPKNIALALATLALGCSSMARYETLPQQEAVNSDFQDRYAIVVAGSGDIGNYYGISDTQNPFYLHGRNVYNQLQRLGFGREDMTLITNGTASYSKLKRVIGEYAEKVDSNDLFVVYIGTHGSPFSLTLEGDGNEGLSVTEFEGLLEEIKPKTGIVYIDACYSGAYISDLSLDDYVAVSSTGHYTGSYSDTAYTPGLEFFSAFSLPSSDANGDGNITIAEAFEASNKSSLRYQQNRIVEGSEMAEEAGFEQEMYVGERASPYYYLISPP